MSDQLYPIGLVAKCDVDLIERTIGDEFEDGSTSTRRLWTDKYFKRRITVEHSPLSEEEHAKLRSFMTARGGRYDSFWFRDNAHRSGNAKVRLAEGFKVTRGASGVYEARLVLEETAPTRVLPSTDEILDINTSVTQSLLLFWFDANREIYYKHLGSTYKDPTVTVWDEFRNYRPPWNSAGGGDIEGEDAQIQYYQGSARAYGGTNLGITSQPAMTLFCHAKCDNTRDGVLFQLGTAGTNGALGLSILTGVIYPWIGGTGGFTGVASTADTWASWAVVWAQGSNVAKIYKNGAETAAGTITRSMVNGPASLLADNAGANTLTGSNYVNNAMAIRYDLTAANIISLHNIFAHQYGLAQV